MSEIARAASLSALKITLKVTLVYVAGFGLCRYFFASLPVGFQVVAASVYFGGAMVWVFWITKHQLTQTASLRCELQAANESFENRVRSRTAELEESLKNNKSFEGIIPICANCKSIRNGTGNWERLESFIQRHSNAMFSHGLCPACNEALYGDQRRRFAPSLEEKVSETA